MCLKKKHTDPFKLPTCCYMFQETVIMFFLIRCESLWYDRFGVKFVGGSKDCTCMSFGYFMICGPRGLNKSKAFKFVPLCLVRNYSWIMFDKFKIYMVHMYGSLFKCMKKKPLDLQVSHDFLRCVLQRQMSFRTVGHFWQSLLVPGPEKTISERFKSRWKVTIAERYLKDTASDIFWWKHARLSLWALVLQTLGRNISELSQERMKSASKSLIHIIFISYTLNIQRQRDRHSAQVSILQV